MADQPQCELFIDSCCDLPFEVVDVEHVHVFKFPYLMDDQECLDDMFQSISPHDFYEHLRKGAISKTAQIPITELMEQFERVAQAGIPAVYLGFTSGLSGTFETASMVADTVHAQYPEAELYVVDTHLASIAEGLLIYEAIRQQQKGLTAHQLALWAKEARNYVAELFMVDDLESLRRGGRIPASVAFAGSKLDVKPMLDINADGRLSVVGVARGRKKGIRQLADFYAKNHVDMPGPQYVVIGHADCPKDAERLKDELAKINESLLFLETSIGPVIGSHVGPGMIALVFWGADAREQLTVSDRIARKIKAQGK